MRYGFWLAHRVTLIQSVKMDYIAERFALGGREMNQTNFKAFLMKYKCTKRKLSRQLNVPCKKVSDWCKGVGVPTSKQALEISIALRCDLQEVYEAILMTR